MKKIIIGIIIGLAFSYISNIHTNTIEKGVIIRIYKHNPPKQGEVTKIPFDNSITFED